MARSQHSGPTGRKGRSHDDTIVALLTEHYLDVRYYVQSLMPGDSSAADVAQQASMTLWRKRDHFEVGTNFKAWAFSIARYEVLNQRKKQARDAKRLVFSEELEEIFAEEIPELNPDLDLRQGALKYCLDKLNPNHRDLVMHRYFKKAPLQDFAEKNNRSPSGLKVTLHRVRNTLQKCIEDEISKSSPEFPASS